MTDAQAPKSQNSRYKIALAGFGHMGSALAEGWTKAGLIERLDILDPASKSCSISNAHLYALPEDFLKNAATWDVLVLAIKPQVLDDFLDGFEQVPPPTLPILSILAGKTIMDVSHKFRVNPIIRAMPNTPSSIGKGMTVACADRKTNAGHRQMAKDLMSATGLFAWADDEGFMDAVTALSGSGPAYVFYMVEVMAKAGIAAGLNADFAMILARQTVIGASALLDTQPNKTPEELRRNVTSPNGTTAAGLSVLMDGRFETIMQETIARAKARSKELSSS